MPRIFRPRVLYSKFAQRYSTGAGNNNKGLRIFYVRSFSNNIATKRVNKKNKDIIELTTDDCASKISFFMINVSVPYTP